MPRYEHLLLVRLPEQLERRKRPGFGASRVLNRAVHSGRLSDELNTAVNVQRVRRPPAAVNPSLLLKVRTIGPLQEEDWQRVGLSVVSESEDRTLVLFSSADDITEFSRRVAEYGGEIPENQKNAPYSSFVSHIESIGALEPDDRIGSRLRESGKETLERFLDDEQFLVDLEIWDLGTRELREAKVQLLTAKVHDLGGVVSDTYVGRSITLMRIGVSGAVLKQLLQVEEVALIDLPPITELIADEALEFEMPDLPALEEIVDELPLIGIVDSGVNNHPLIEEVLVNAIGTPAELGSADDHGHGTRVAGVAVFGDIREQIASNLLVRKARICSAKVVNEHGKFSDQKLVPSQMREAIASMHGRLGCRVFVISLCDITQVYDGGKVGTWAATLDELARELDVVIVVAVGNRAPRTGDDVEQAVGEYPGYLLETDNRLFEPAGAINVLSVGSISHGGGLGEAGAEYVHVVPITGAREPSPFTRIGPGVGGCTKPDFVDIGGTLVFDGLTQRLRRGSDLASAGVLTLHHLPLERLIASGSGTSYSAPFVALKAGQILRTMPNASANLVRALLANAAEIPVESIHKLHGIDAESIRAICGNGHVNPERAAYSDDARVVFYAEDFLVVDNFAVYEIPIPLEFQTESGRRRIRIALAYRKLPRIADMK